MIIWVDDRLFEQGARDIDRLALLRGASFRRHTLIVSASPATGRRDRASPFFDRWREALPARLGSEVRLLCERLALVSGNAVARGAGLLRYEHGGGINGIATLVKHFSDDDRCRQAFGLPSRLWRLVHIIVYDHDGEQPEQPGEGARQVERACRDAGLDEHSHRLQRRDQEHYLPPEALQKIVHAHQWQSDHDREQFTAKIKTHIERGYDRHFTELPRLGKEPFFKNEFDRPADWFDDDWFRRDGAWPEMTLLAEKIAAAI